MIVDWITGAGLQQETYYTGFDYISLYGGGSRASANVQTVTHNVVGDVTGDVAFPVADILIRAAMLLK